MFLKNIVLLGIITTVLSNCTPPLTREQILAGYQNTCSQYGFVYGTDAFAQCMMEQEKIYLKQSRHYDKMNEKRLRKTLPPPLPK